MLKEKPKATGTLEIVLRDQNGNVKDQRKVNNLVVDTGLAYIADRMADAAESAMSHMAVGTGSTAAASGDTTLETEAGRVALTSTTQTNEDVVYVATFSAGTGTGALTEAGILNGASGGTLLCRTVFSTVNKGASDSLQITWTVSMAAS
jgi:hypothetical protein